MAEPEPDPEDARLRALGDELMRLTRRHAVVYAGSQLETSAFRLLWLLTEGPPRTLRELAEELQLEQSTVTRQTTAAIRHGLVERYAVPGEASRLHRPTEAGLAAFRHDAALRAEVYGAALAGLGDERSEQLTGLLRELNDALDERLRRA